MSMKPLARHLLLSSCAVFAPPSETGAGKASVPAAGKSPFAHLARGNSKPAAAEDDKDKKEGASEKDEGEEDDEDGGEGKKSKNSKSKKAEDGEDDEEASKDDENCEEKDDDKKSKKSKKGADDGDDDSDRDDEDDTEARRARGRERGRIRAIVTSDAGKLNPVAAMHLACDTSMSRRQAIGTLNALGAPVGATEPKKTDALRNRMSGVETPDIGSSDANAAANANSAKATAAAIIAAGKKARGEK